MLNTKGVGPRAKGHFNKLANLQNNMLLKSEADVANLKKDFIQKNISSYDEDCVIARPIFDQLFSWVLVKKPVVQIS